MTVKRIVILLLLIAAIIGVFIWFGDGYDYRNLPPTADGPWVAFGDSLTEGYGASPGYDYPSLLGKRLGIDIQNLGKTGETSEDGLNRIDSVVAVKPRVALLCFGGNDALQGKPVSQTTANLAQIIDRLHGEGSFVVLIGIRSASLRDRNESDYEKLARQKEVLYVPDMLKGLAFKPIYMSDAIHPNDAGYARIAERLDKALKPVIARLRFSEK